MVFKFRHGHSTPKDSASILICRVSTTHDLGPSIELSKSPSLYALRRCQSSWTRSDFGRRSLSLAAELQLYALIRRVGAEQSIRV